MKSTHSYAHCPEQTKLEFLGCNATNDETESIFCGATYQVQKYGHINLALAVTVSGARRDVNLFRLTPKKDKKRKGIFHWFDGILRTTIIHIGVKDTPCTQAVNNKAMDLQLKAKQTKEDTQKENNTAKAAEEYIVAIYYHQM